MPEKEMGCRKKKTGAFVILSEAKDLWNLPAVPQRLPIA